MTPHSTVKGFYLSSAFWFVIGTFAGLIDATHLAAPDFLGNIPWIVFGRLRPMHTNIVIFGFVGSALLGTAHYLVAALLRAPLFSEGMGRASLLIWNLAVLTGTVTLSLGYSQSREYAEWIWPVDVLLLTSMALIFYNLFETARRRTEKL